MDTERRPGDVFARHRVEALLGRGGMGIVYRATELEGAGREVALKLIRPEHAADAQFRDRFEREARLARQIEHPNVVPVFDAGEHEGIAYMTMPLVSGIDLEALLAGRGALHPRHAAAVAAPAARALGAAHDLGLVHRDVKPANILLEPREDGEPHVWLMDFGLTKHRESTSGLTRTGQWVGTIDYAAPEQINGERVDGRTDLYALGCVLHECLTGSVPFAAAKDVSKIMAHLTETPPAASDVAAGVPAGFDAVVARAMAKRPDERYPLAELMADAIEAAAAGSPPAPAEPLVAAGSAGPAPDVDRDSPTII
jgi:serine/threonine protein kinase